MHPNMDDEMRRIVGQMGEEWVEGPLRFVHGGGAEEQDSVMMEGQKDGNPRHGIASIIQGSFSDQQRLRREQYRDAEIELSQSHWRVGHEEKIDEKRQEYAVDLSWIAVLPLDLNSDLEISKPRSLHFFCVKRYIRLDRAPPTSGHSLIEVIAFLLLEFDLLFALQQSKRAFFAMTWWRENRLAALWSYVQNRISLQTRTALQTLFRPWHQPRLQLWQLSRSLSNFAPSMLEC